MSYTGIIILNYNNYEDTINCINSIEKYNTSPIKYVVVDNCSSRKNVVTSLDSYFKDNFKSDYQQITENSKPNQSLPKLSFIVNHDNGGYAKGNNIGLSLLFEEEDISNIMILNNDVIFVEDIIDKLVSKLYSMPGCAIISPILYKKEMKGIDYNCARSNCTTWDIILTYLFWYRDFFGILTKINNRRLLLKKIDISKCNECIDIELPSGSCMISSKSIWKKINGFDPNTFLYYEENILFKKIKQLNMRNYLLTTAKCIHLGASSTQHAKSDFILKTGLKSATYYLNTYCKLNIIEKLFLNIAKYSFLLKCNIISFIQKQKVLFN